MCCTPLDLFFSVKQKTAYELRMSDWSSDVCSSDLASPTAISSCSATGSRAAQATHMAGRSGLPRADPLDVGADGLECLLKPLVTAVAMIDPIEPCLSFGGVVGDDQAHRCAEVGRPEQIGRAQVGLPVTHADI